MQNGQNFDSWDDRKYTAKACGRKNSEGGGKAPLCLGAV